MPNRLVAYYRVSTERQGRSGLGLDAQREAVRSYVESHGGALCAEFVEIETGKNNDRPRLAEALRSCRLTGATLVVGKLDRLARNARFLLSIVEGTGDGGVVFCDLPEVPAGPVGKFLVTQMAAVAELEAGLIAARTKAALGAAKARGAKLGGWRGGPKIDPAAGRAARSAQSDAFAASIGPMAASMRAEGLSLRQIAAQLTEQGIRTPQGGAWTADAVRRLLARHAPSSDSQRAPEAIPAAPAAVAS
ncbi:recombinase family protein [Acidiphilium multivorum]|uniref:recombinase family protein n=1 Tax=Acidiphilium multivorum TaxID=62140 RepID=UPI0039C8C0EA